MQKTSFDIQTYLKLILEGSEMVMAKIQNDLPEVTLIVIVQKS